MPASSKQMVKYTVKDSTTVDLDGGRIAMKFSAGEHTPKNDEETEALEHLVSIGAATRSKAKEA